MPSTPESAGGFIGRAEELAVVEAAIDAGGCVIAGDAGVGKTRLAMEAVRDRPVVRVLATRSAASVPYGAFAHLLDVSALATTNVIPEAIRLVRDQHPDAVPVVLVDDAHLLDDASAALVLALATTGAAHPVVTVRRPEPTPDAISALWKERGLERFELQSLGRSDVAALVRAELGGDAHPRAVARIAELSLGNPLYVHELLYEARQTRSLELAPDGWLWHEELLTFDRLSDLIERHARTVSDGAWDALELVAVSGHLPLPVLVGLTSDTAVEELEQKGLVSVGSDAAGEVRVAHPLYGEVVTAGMPHTTGLRARRRAATALTAAGADQLQIAALLLDAGISDPEQFIDASGIALRRGGVKLALRLAEAAGEGLDAALAVAGALLELGRFNDVEPVLEPHEASAASAPLPVSADYVDRRCRALLRGALPDTVRVDLLERAATWHTDPEWEALIATEHGWTAFYADRCPDALACVEGIAGDTRLSPHRRFRACVVQANVYACLDRLDDFVQLLPVVRALVTAMGTPSSEARVVILHLELYPLIGAARGLLGIEVRMLEARAEAAAAGDTALHTAASMILGLVSLRRGHPEAAILHLEEAAADATDADVMNNAMWIAMLRVTAHAYRGNAERARVLVGELERLELEFPRKARRQRVDNEAAKALADAAAGRTSVAVSRLLALADGHNDPAAEVQTLYEALRIGADPRQVADALRIRLVEAQDEQAERYLVHADALVSGDAAAQLELAREFHACGCDLYAAEAAARAAEGYAAAGLQASAREAGALAALWADACGPVSSWALERRSDALVLTAREREIAVLAARGLANKAIAEELFLSVRTVESHLLRACQKLGVASRTSLPDVLPH